MEPLVSVCQLSQICLEMSWVTAEKGCMSPCEQAQCHSPQTSPTWNQGNSHTHREKSKRRNKLNHPCSLTRTSRLLGG
ncbi:hypothetical protein XELAEV_18004129mg [Xenopus laevis]|uniref:Uncharacterized protein n=1 Tax=Xenopus laevis TaxID=8355 RepID=A0A974BS39_XENLA|nr:hypothetical protein XELAEV_18004129mg [Xenopus laevis]